MTFLEETHLITGATMKSKTVLKERHNGCFNKQKQCWRRLCGRAGGKLHAIWVFLLVTAW